MRRRRLAGATRAQLERRNPARGAGLRSTCAALLLACVGPVRAAALVYTLSALIMVLGSYWLLTRIFFEA